MFREFSVTTEAVTSENVVFGIIFYVTSLVRKQNKTFILICVISFARKRISSHLGHTKVANIS